MPSYRFVQEACELYCYVRRKKHLVVTVSGMRFLLPMSIARDKQALTTTKEVLATQVDLFGKALKKGMPVEEVDGVLSIGALLNFELSLDTVGDLLGIPRAPSEPG